MSTNTELSKTPTATPSHCDLIETLPKGVMSMSHHLSHRGSRFSARIGPSPRWAFRPFAVQDPADNLNDDEYKQGAHSNRSHDQPG
jgi:hypothetical protein